MRVIRFHAACRANGLILDVYSCYRTEMSSVSFESLSSHSKPEVDRKVTNVRAAVVAVRHWRLRWMHLENSRVAAWRFAVLMVGMGGISP